MTTTKKIPPIVQIAAWLLSLIAFAVGFWHTHLGIKQMNVFESEYGSIAIAAIVLLMILITYWFAVNGRKAALVLYIICGAFVFVFNLNYFYPAYMGRNLVNEEAKVLNDTLQSYANIAKSTTFNKDDVTKLNKAEALISQILAEINGPGASGKGNVAMGKILEFKNLYKEVTGSDVNLEAAGGVGGNLEEKNAIAQKMKLNLYPAYETMKQSSVKGKNAISIIEGINKLDTIQKMYGPILESIQLDKSNISLDSVKSHPQINKLISLVKHINEATSLINKGKGKDIFVTIDEKVMPSTQFLGQIENTLLTIKARINKISTWAILLVCLFIDLLVPLGMFLLLKKDENAEVSVKSQGKFKPTNFNR
jgi:hypothetical protein